MYRVHFVLFAILSLGCMAPELGDVQAGESLLTAAERRARAGQIRDAAFDSGLTQGWLLAGIADSETSMSHCHSELTWACRGPNSSDCGGGPVVAGAGDGPCDLRQGGLGMFQFDAGTYDDTLRREGDRILSIAGNVEAAVDFTVAMVIRSVYIDGVDNREQAIAWMNGVRVGNERWDPWITTVTHYYNGCTPSAGCFDSRYARYRDHTSDIHGEMGADFWNVSHAWGGAYAHQTFPLAANPFELYPGQEVSGYIEMRNTGTGTWRPGETFLGTTQPRDGASAIAGPDWVSASRAATIDGEVAPGAMGRFNFTVRAPNAIGEYPQFFSLVQEGVAWFSDQGGPPDDQLQVRVSVVSAPPCPDGLGEAWTCEGDDRVRCVFGETMRETCTEGCADGESFAVCAGPPVDSDGDGFFSDVDCDDSRAGVNPDADDACGDGLDQDCDGLECALADPEGRGHMSGCSASADARAPSALALFLFAAIAFVRRRSR
jgi:MYXO-CTERM domain-containing protein